MNDEVDLKTKTDVLDLVISFLMEHEKKMDLIVQRLERISERLSRSRYSTTKSTSPLYPPNSKPGTFTLTINNPDNFERIKSIKIDWKTTKKKLFPEDAEMDAILEEIEYVLRDN
ncbi:MAG: hypothetical protein JSV18_03020 [Candidatus Bathyarchaeota archaeon]|nr:MAG: hypothetical protein JSV18_03020 [Candidatus Bathyarchaeota archaeon]